MTKVLIEAPDNLHRLVKTVASSKGEAMQDFIIREIQELVRQETKINFETHIGSNLGILSKMFVSESADKNSYSAKKSVTKTSKVQLPEISSASQNVDSQDGTKVADDKDSSLFSWLRKNSESRTSRTAGHFVGLDLVMTDVRFHERFTQDNKTPARNTKPSYSNYGFGGGLNYKYAINFNKFFVAPGIFFEQNNTTASGKGSNSLERIDIKRRYGLKSDFGYDVTNALAPYLTGGYSRISYTTQNFSSSGGISTSYVHDSNVGDWFYGAGLKVRYNDDIMFNLEYNRQSFLAQTLVVNSVSYLGLYKTNLNIFKAGISYNF